MVRHEAVEEAVKQIQAAAAAGLRRIHIPGERASLFSSRRLLSRMISTLEDLSD